MELSQLTLPALEAYFRHDEKANRLNMSKIVDGLGVLWDFCERKSIRFLCLIRRACLKISVSSCHDVLQALQARGYLYEVAPRAGYYPTLRLQSLSKVIAE